MLLFIQSPIPQNAAATKHSAQLFIETNKMLNTNAICIIIVESTPIIFFGNQSAKNPQDNPPTNSATPSAMNTDETLLSMADCEIFQSIELLIILFRNPA